MKWSINFFILGCCCLACTERIVPTSNQNSLFRLSSTEISEMIDLITTREGVSSNFHVLYSEHLNDSAGLIRVWQSPLKANKSLGLCEIIRYKQNHIFVYDSIRCRQIAPDSLASSTMDSPFFILHSPQWMILAKRRKEQVNYYNVSPFTKYDETLETPSDLFKN